MADWWFWILLPIFIVVAALLIRRTLHGAVVDKLPIAQDERVLLTDTGLKVRHRIRDAYGGHGMMSGVTMVLTDRRVILATGGPEGTHKFLLRYIIEYVAPPRVVSGSGYGAYYSKFQLRNGFATYQVPPGNASIVEQGGETGLRFEVPFPEHGPFYLEPQIIIYSTRAREVLKAISG